MAFEIPTHTVLPVETIAVRLNPDPHPFELANGPAVDANWTPTRLSLTARWRCFPA
jgi:hypothetical protein